MQERLKADFNVIEKDFIKPESDRLIEELQKSETSPLRRSAIGDRLCIINDTRRGVGVYNDNVPELFWCPVPGGNVTIFNVDIEGNKPIKTFSVNPFYISKYPITYKQFQTFIDDKNGYKNSFWWEGLAKKYENPDEQRFKLPNYPRETVNWYEAVAFSRWITNGYKTRGFTVGEVDNNKWQIRLPTEWEWQQAATGGEAENIYSWGSIWKPVANVQEIGLDKPLAVGMFPENQSSIGALDMCGGVWEWCLNKYNDPFSTELSGQSTRVFRGGSFTRDKFAAQTVYRFHSDPLSRRYDLGFRLALAYIE
jgi:formylglycine-generating enzyme required for sulfatase activity